MSGFDPFNATMEQAQAEPDAWAMHGAVSRLVGASQLTENREFYEAHPVDGMAHCAMHGLVAPDWLARKFLGGFYAVVNAKAGSWDEAFGAPFPKGTQLPAVRRRRRQRFEIALLATEFVQMHPDLAMSRFWELFDPAAKNRAGIDAGVSERASRIGVSKSLAQELYAKAVERGETSHHDDVRRKLRPLRAAGSARTLQAALREFGRSPGKG